MSTVEKTKLTPSPRKPSASNDPGKFPTECIFCEKQTTRKSHGNKEQCFTIAVFKDNQGVKLDPVKIDIVYMKYPRFGFGEPRIGVLLLVVEILSCCFEV